MPDSPFAAPLLSPIFASEKVARIFSESSLLQAMLDFEAALAHAEAEAGVIPKSAVAPIAKVCDAKLFDIAAIGHAAVASGNVAIPLVKALTAQAPKEARDFVHYGATSQDVIDTSMMLCAREACAVMRADISAAMQALIELIGAHRDTLMAGRTLMQQALPITFAYKAATWLSGLTYAAERMRRVEREGLALQFGGAVGTLAALGDKGVAVRKALAARLKLHEAPVSWHADRGRILDIASALAGLSAASAKVAGDVMLLMQTEVGEVFEAAVEGKGGSSTMPHKRNPVASVAITANHLRIGGLATVILAAPPIRAERDIGSWQAEWETLRDLFTLTAGSIERLGEMLQDLEVNPSQMRKNLDATGGVAMSESLTFALARKLGRGEASRLAEQATKDALSQELSLAEIAKADAGISAALTAAEIDQAVDPERYLGSADTIVDAALADARQFLAG